MRGLIIVLITLGASSHAIASDVKSDVLPATKVVTVEHQTKTRPLCGRARMALNRPQSGKPVSLTTALSRIREIQDARDKRTGVVTKHSQITYEQATNPPEAPHHCHRIVKTKHSH